MPSTDSPLPGIHHVTAITADPQKNIDFYCGVLGQRLVKLTVNFDDPGSYHLYYGDELGRPGSILTFFAWPGAFRGRVGPPQVTVTAYAAPPGSIDYWSTRLQDHHIDAKPPETRFGQRVIALTDPDGLQLEIIETAGPRGQPWAAGPVSPDYALAGFHSVTIAEEGYENTAKLLTDVMGFTSIGNEQNRFRYQAAGNNQCAAVVDLLCAPDARHGNTGAGVVHHIAFRTPDDAAQKTWHTKLAAKGFNVSPVMDRTYFHSIYYREPGGVLFEIATCNPGFTIDEPASQLGSTLMLPKWLEPHRSEILRIVPPVRLPKGRV